MIKGFEPIVGDEPKILILGSMPSVTSLNKNEYYGFKYNRFWSIISTYFHQKYETYDDKIQGILTHHIALWDVIASCEREGSLDSKIKNEICNDIRGLINNYPSIKGIICNGKKSYSLYIKYFNDIDIPCICLPSTSNANRSIHEQELFKKWYFVLDKYI